LDVRILSAGYGLIGGSKRILSYDESFAGLRRAEIDERAEALGVRASFNRLLSKPYALALVLLGDDYLRATSLGPETPIACPTIVFGGARLVRNSDIESLKIVPAGKQEARRFSCGLVGLKGEISRRLLMRFAAEPELVSQVAQPDVDVLQMLDTAALHSFEVAA
jgi:hypothetical protein